MSAKTEKPRSGCPFTNFGPCAETSCAFSVFLPPELKERSCLIRANYQIAVVSRMLLLSDTLFPVNLPQDLLLQSETSHLVKSLINCLLNLDALLSSPQTGAPLKRQIMTWKRELHQAFTRFSAL